MWVANPCIPRNESDYSDHFSDLDTDTDDDSKIDPRVQDELERLNNATDAINKLEVELDDARAAFRQLLTESTQRIDSLAKQLGNSVEKARPYYEAKMRVKEAHSETQKAALRFERANSAHSAAKEMVFLAEEGLQKEGRTFDPAWQEMLNHATMRVNESECERNLSEQEHRRTSKGYSDADRLVKDLKKDLKKTITKSSLSARRSLLQLNDLSCQHQLILLPYFDMKAQFKKVLDEQKRRVEELEESVLRSKQSYSDALHNLEEISDEIHRRRKRKEERQALGARGPGVGAENPEPSRKSEDKGDGATELVRDPEGDRSPEQLVKLRFPKSLSSSTLSHMTSTQTQEERQDAVTCRLRKSKSVYVRHDGTGGLNHPLFGRYSISRNFKLQVDHASQTDEHDPSGGLSSAGTDGDDKAVLGLALGGGEDNLLDVGSRASSSVGSTPNFDEERMFRCLTVDDAYDLTDGGATSSSNKSSLQGSEATSPTATTNGLTRGGAFAAFAMLAAPAEGRLEVDDDLDDDDDGDDDYAAGGDKMMKETSSSTTDLSSKKQAPNQIVHRTTQTFPFDVVPAAGTDLAVTVAIVGTSQLHREIVHGAVTDNQPLAADLSSPNNNGNTVAEDGIENNGRVRN